MSELRRYWSTSSGMVNPSKDEPNGGWAFYEDALAYAGERERDGEARGAQRERDRMDLVLTRISAGHGTDWVNALECARWHLYHPEAPASREKVCTCGANARFPIHARSCPLYVAPANPAPLEGIAGFVDMDERNSGMIAKLVNKVNALVDAVNALIAKDDSKPYKEAR